jgi:hypothetical protein
MHSVSSTFSFNIGKLAILTIFWEFVLTEDLENSPVTMTHYLSDVTLTKESCNALVTLNKNFFSYIVEFPFKFTWDTL